MSGKAPSPFQLERAMGELLQAREMLLALDPDMQQDERLFADMLDGESGNAMQVLEQVIEASIDAAAMAAAARIRKDDLAARQARYERRCDTLRTAALNAMQALGLARLERPAFTASIRNGQGKVVITDPDAVPEAFIRTERAFDKASIGAALKAGDEVTGATLSNGEPSLTLRTK